MVKFIINNEYIETDLSPGILLIDYIRNNLKLTGTKEACKEGECGACTVLIGKLNKYTGSVDYKSCASCILPIGDVNNCHIVTVEGLTFKNFSLIQKIIIDNSASQCGFCTPGIVLSLTGYCFSSNNFEYNDAIDALDGNICRCTGYVSIRDAAKNLSEVLRKEDPKKDRLSLLIDMNIVPKYFTEIPEKLKELCNDSTKEISENTVFVGGGTDLFVQRPDELEERPLYFISSREDLNYITSNSDFIYVGGAATLESFKNSPVVKKYFTSLQKDVLLHSSTILRNKATLTGNIVNASPIGDITIMLLVLDTILVIESKDSNRREVKLKDFYKGYKDFDLKSTEIIREIKIPVPTEKFYYNFEKVSNRKILDIASVNTAIYLETDENGLIKDIRISAGGVAPVPLFIKEIAEFKGQKVEADKIAEKVGSLVSPIDDVRGTAKYKKLLLKQLVKAHFNF